MKHIESILPEQVADELTRFLLDDATISSALKDLLHRDTGCDIPSLDDVPISDIEEMIPLCLSILRRFWNTPLTALGDGTNKKSLADTFKRLINNCVQGNEALGIPAANENIPSAVSALTKRHIDDGCTLTLSDGTTTSLPNGLSIVQLLCGPDVASQVSEIVDSNKGWVANDESGDILLSRFPNCETLTLGMVEIKGNGKYISNNSNLKGTVSFPHLKQYGKPTEDKTNGIIYGCPNVTKLYMPELGYVNHYSRNSGDVFYAMIGKMQGLEEIEFGNITTWTGDWTGQANFIIDCPKCGFLKFKGIHCSMNLIFWSPTTALSERLDEFLSNFQQYIADRVEDRTGNAALTLTLSTAVYAALEAQEGQTILATLANKNWNVAQA